MPRGATFTWHKDGLDASFLARTLEFEGAGHAAAVGQRHGRHATISGTANQLAHGGGAL